MRLLLSVQSSQSKSTWCRSSFSRLVPARDSGKSCLPTLLLQPNRPFPASASKERGAWLQITFKAPPLWMRSTQFWITFLFVSSFCCTRVNSFLEMHVVSVPVSQRLRRLTLSIHVLGMFFIHYGLIRTCVLELFLFPLLPGMQYRFILLHHSNTVCARPRSHLCSYAG